MKRATRSDRPSREGKYVSRVDPSVTAVGEYEELVDRWADGSQAVWRQHCDALYVALIDRWLPGSPAGRTLKTDLFDEAMGEGLVARLATGSEMVLGIDSSTAVASAASEKHASLRTALADVRNLPLRDGSLGRVFSNSTLDHFANQHDIIAALRELARVVAPNGQLILTLDNPHNPAVRVRNLLPFSLLRRLGLVPYFVGATLSAHALNAALQQAGFEVRDTVFLMHCPRVLMVPIAVRLGRSSAAVQGRFLRSLMRWERLRSWPTARHTGHYFAVSAVRK